MPTRTGASQIHSGSVTLSYVRFGSKADILHAGNDVCFIPKSGRSSPRARSGGDVPFS